MVIHNLTFLADEAWNQENCYLPEVTTEMFINLLFQVDQLKVRTNLPQCTDVVSYMSKGGNLLLLIFFLWSSKLELPNLFIIQGETM